MKFKPGTKFSYNNSAFVFLAVVIEKLIGDYHEWSILAPAQLTIYENAFINNEKWLMV